MRLSELGEDAFLRQLRSKFPRAEGVPVGVGDDAAVVAVPEGEHVILTVDALVEGSHFHRETLPPRYLGRKAVAASASDIAAMGGVGIGVLLSLAVPGDLEVESLWQIVDGAAGRATELGMALVGGNVARSEAAVMVDVTAAGATRSGGRALTRNRARPGDGIYVSGKIGASASGLELLKRGAVVSSSGGLVVPEDLRQGPLALAESCIRAHLDPEPRLELGGKLNELEIATACIDISDGLSRDLRRLSDASGVGARIEERSLPIDPGVLAWERLWNRDPTRVALSGGEDYELLFTARGSKKDVKKVEALRDAADISITKIGEIVDTDGGVEIVRRDGTIENLDALGWDHFQSA